MTDTAYEFKKLSDVDTVEDLQDEDTILVVSGGSVKQVSKEKVCGNSSVDTTYFVMSNYREYRTGQDWNTGTEVTADDIVAAYEKGIVKLFVMYGGNLMGVANVVGYRMYNEIKQPLYIDPNARGIEYLS